MEYTNYGETEVLETTYTQNETSQSVAPQYYAPVLQLPTGRSLVKMIFLSLITFGIYGIVIYCRIAEEINIVASRYDGKRTMSYMGMMMLSPITLGIYSIVWVHKLSNRIGAEVRRRGYDYNFSATDYWLWGVIGSIIIVGPFIYCHKLLKCMNMVNCSYNIYG